LTFNVRGESAERQQTGNDEHGRTHAIHENLREVLILAARGQSEFRRQLVPPPKGARPL
jgi:hypothetical protein